MTFFSKLNSIMRQDFGSRGLMKALPEADLDLVSQENSRRPGAFLFSLAFLLSAPTKQ